MFAALVRSQNDIMALAATLGSLVEGAAAGLIGHAVVILPEGPTRNELERLSDATGADMITASASSIDDWKRAASQARGDWVVILNAGEVFTQGWISAIERHAITSGGKAGFIPLAGWRGVVEFTKLRLFPRNIQSGHVMPISTMMSGAASGGMHHKYIRLGVRRETIG